MNSLRRLIVATSMVAAIATDGFALSGQWFASPSGNQMHLNLMIEPHSQNGFTVPIAELEGLTAAQIAAQQSTPVEFQLRRAAGTMTFRGQFGAESGSGRFTFTPDDSFLREMRDLGYPNLDEEKSFLFTTTNFSAQNVRDLRALGYRPSANELEEVAIFKITPGFVQELASLGYEGIKLEDLVELRIGHIDANRIREYRSLGYDNIPASKLGEVGIQGVTPDFIRNLAAVGYRNISLDQLVEMKIFKVTPAFIKSLQDAGYENVPVRKLIEIKMAGADEIFVKKH